MEQETLIEAFIRGNHSQQDKLKRKKILKQRKLRKCSGNMTPHTTTVNGVVKVTCKPKDRKRARMMKRVQRRLKSNPNKVKRARAKAQDTRKFRNW